MDLEQIKTLNESQVVEYLRNHPNFIKQNPTLLSQIAPPRRDLGPGIGDLQQAMLERLREENEKAKSRQSELIKAGRNNLSIQARIHECVIALLSANSFEQLLQIVTTDFAIFLDLDIVTLCVESGDMETTPLRTRGLKVIKPGLVDALIGVNRDVMLRSNIDGNREIFGGGATLVRSEALSRILIAYSSPACMLAFGSRHTTKFHEGQATDLLGFLSRVTQGMIRIWLQLPN